MGTRTVTFVVRDGSNMVCAMMQPSVNDRRNYRFVYGLARIEARGYDAGHVEVIALKD